MKDFLRLIIPYFYGTDKKYARWCGLILLLLSQVSTSFGYLFIQWNRRFYDALEARNYSAFVREELIFAALAVIFVLSFSLTRYYGQQYALRWRMWMTNTALAKWLHDEKRGQLEGSDQRIQEDLMRFTMIFERFFLDCFNAVLLILLLTPMLFMQTKDLYILGLPLGFVIFGVSVFYTVLGMFISAKIANPLINLEYDNQKLEAEFRYNLVHVRDGATKSHGFFKSLLESISINYNKIYGRQKHFNLWHKAYDQFSFLIPFMLLATPFFGGFLTLGMLMQIRSTFSRVRNSMAYLLDHYTELTEMLAISKRLVEFYDAAQIDLSSLQGYNVPANGKLLTE
jgi:vitamin B12/bleomycin/antimicrobial peptide transport system ATP-binding/permease protein